jgi:hypothetical protein
MANQSFPSLMVQAHVEELHRLALRSKRGTTRGARLTVRSRPRGRASYRNGVDSR